MRAPPYGLYRRDYDLAVETSQQACSENTASPAAYLILKEGLATKAVRLLNQRLINNAIARSAIPFLGE